MIVVSDTIFKTNELTQTLAYGNVKWTSGTHYWRI
jgi:hypothetical protein